MTGRLSILAALALAALALGALSTSHADEIVLRADAPIVDVTINGKPARLLVDTSIPAFVAINPAAATRLGVRTAPLVKAAVESDGVRIIGRVARPRIVFANGAAARALTGLFGASFSPAAGIDGGIGPGVLPYDRVRIVLRDGPSAPVARVFALANPRSWRVAAPLAGEPGFFGFNLGRSETLLSRPAARLLSEASLVTPSGDLRRMAFPLGLSTSVQPVRTAQSIGGFDFATTLARTEAPKLGPDGEDAITVTANKGKAPDYALTLGREALANCSDILWERAEKRLTVRCDD